MANWVPLRRLLADSELPLTLTWAELEQVVGDLPPSAYRHSAFWKGERSRWSGYTTSRVDVGHAVTFIRRATNLDARPPEAPSGGEQRRAPRQLQPQGSMLGTPTPESRSVPPRPSLVLVSCGSSKLRMPAPAKDLYTSARFQKARRYAEVAGVPWFVLSGKHGVLHPDEVVAPYDRYLGDLTAGEQRAWGEQVCRQLGERGASLGGATVEVHAGARYVAALRAPLTRAGAALITPLAGLGQGQTLSWYNAHSAQLPAGACSVDVPTLVAALGDPARAVTMADYVASGGAGSNSPGLYSWWVDRAGAAELTRGLGSTVNAGLLYAGLAGAAKARSSKQSPYTVWRRITQMHLRDKKERSTLRRSIGSVLAEAKGGTRINEAALTEWMFTHLRVNTYAGLDPLSLVAVETAVLAALDPPFNLQKVPATLDRRRLKALRKKHAGRSPE